MLGWSYTSHPGPDSLLECLSWHYTTQRAGARSYLSRSRSWAGWVGEKDFPMIEWPYDSSGGGWNMATLHSLQDGRRGARSVLDLEAIFLDPGSIEMREDVLLFLFDESVTASHVYPPTSEHRDLVRGLTSGKVRACIIHDVSGPRFGGLLTTRVDEGSDRYCRVEHFYGFVPKMGQARTGEVLWLPLELDGDRWTRWNSQLVADSGWQYERLLLE